MDSCGALSSLPTDSSFVQKLEADTIAYIEDNNPSFNNKNDVSRGDLLLGIFQEDTSQETFDFAKRVEKDPSSVQREMQCYQSKVAAPSKVFQYKEFRERSRGSMTKVRLDKEVKLIRIFPGPAGLIPDVKNDHVSAASYLSSVKELENKTATKRIEIQSQDEKNLIGERAWKFLLNDLPNNFLQDYGISTVKDKANASHCDSTKVRFIAGILDYVDHSHDDPFVIIKDSSGSIEGTIHRDIPLTYPGILEPNVVIFLHDVGLLKTTTYVVTNKYHVLVSLVNLLAIYSDKGRIVNTSLMESVLSHTSNVELNRNNNTVVSKSVFISELQKINESRDVPLQTSTSDTLIKDYESELAKDPLLYSINKRNENYGKAFKKTDKTCRVTDKILEHSNYSMDTDDLNMDVFFTTDCDFITSEEQNCLNRSPSKSVSQISKIQRCDLQVQNTKHLENTKKESTNNFRKQIKERHLPQTLQKCVTDIKTCLSSCDDTIRRDSNSNVKSILPAIKRNIENSKTLVSYFINDKYDSDDEILSQLDVDNVF